MTRREILLLVERLRYEVTIGSGTVTPLRQEAANALVALLAQVPRPSAGTPGPIDGIRAAILVVERHSATHTKETGVHDHTTNVVEFDEANELVDGAYQDLLTDLATLRDAQVTA